MLVLSRRVGEEVVIDGRIRIRVTSVGAGHAKLGIVAPATIRIDREEVHARRSDEVPHAADQEPVADKTNLQG